DNDDSPRHVVADLNGDCSAPRVHGEPGDRSAVLHSNRYAMAGGERDDIYLTTGDEPDTADYASVHLNVAECSRVQGSSWQLRSWKLRRRCRNFRDSQDCHHRQHTHYKPLHVKLLCCRGSFENLVRLRMEMAGVPITPELSAT